MITTEDKALVEAAREGRSRAYASYSQFAVGAAVQTSSGKIFHGCNIENAAYPVTCCAERVAIFSAYAAGEREIIALAVVADTPGPVSPCGSCRQVIFELAHDARIILANMGDAAVATTPDALLPGGFTPEDLHEGRR